MHTIKSSTVSRRKTSSESGYNLLQLSITLMVIGVMIGSFFYAYNIYEKNQKILETNKNIQSAINIIQGYRSLTGAYPCPAPLNAARTDALYGHASSCQPNLIPVSALNALGIGTCGTTAGTKGLCIEQSILATLTNRRVIIGAIPFRDLQIDETSTFDGYDHRLVYAVTQSMTAQDTFDEKNGAINIINAAGQPLVDPAGLASFVILSHGATGVGAYTSTGNLYSPCAGLGLDVQNCNPGFESGTSSTTNAVFRVADLSTNPGANFYDDLVAYFSQITDPMWRRADADPENIRDLAPSNVGIGIATPSTELEISSTSESKDSLRAYGTSNNGKIMTPQLCDTSATPLCITPSQLATDTIKCATGFMQGISNGVAVCIPTIDAKCPDDYPIMTGVTTGGVPTCSEVPGKACPATNQTVCTTNDVTLPKTNDGASVTLWGGIGGCRSKTWTCSNGTWSKTGDNYRTCSLSLLPYTKTGLSCGTGYTGTYTETYMPTCDGNGTKIGDTFAAACKCVGYSSTATKKCASGASYTETTTMTCPNNWTTSSTAPTACTCASQPTTYAYSNCPSGQTRKASAPASYFTGATSTQQGIVTVKSFNNDPSVCAFNSQTYNYCETPCVPGSALADVTAPHTCSDMTCTEPDPSNPDVFSVKNDSTCSSSTIKTLKTAGSCKAKSFKWISYGTSGSTAGSIGSNIIGQGCSCSDYSATLSSTKNCFLASDPTKTIYNCRCQ